MGQGCEEMHLVTLGSSPALRIAEDRCAYLSSYLLFFSLYLERERSISRAAYLREIHRSADPREIQREIESACFLGMQLAVIRNISASSDLAHFLTG